MTLLFALFVLFVLAFGLGLVVTKWCLILALALACVLVAIAIRS